ncbi:MAG: hypothetical protein HN567_07000 [Actinobacteria bacterium]|nr:hypothetical protein [Actinomycetota bacterium]MDE0928491.1 hypothetical protein [Acidimicrobiales bacterium]MBT3746473.1 hypothetical protein [Actinomycetota bacterium]MBT3970562.1 hypothetical protein [Actinomycetota bacterium]MBT4009339.1 hypothetical protein [Actinomycetota bacterium]
MEKTLMLAHQGGWDEILVVAGPLLVVATLLWVADRRARRMGPPPDDQA